MTDDELVELVKSIADDLRFGSFRMSVDVSPKVFLVTEGDDGIDVHIWNGIPSPLQAEECGRHLIGLGGAMCLAGRSVLGGVLQYTYDGYVMLSGKSATGATFWGGSYVGDLLPGNRATITEAFKYSEGKTDINPLDLIFLASTPKNAVAKQKIDELATDDETLAKAKEIQKGLKLQRYKPINWGNI
jgi:hypothetical protein